MTRKAPSRIALSVAIVLVLALVPTAVAGKGGHASGTATAYSAAVSPDGPYVFSQQVWVTTNAPLYADNMGPWIGLTCYQNGLMVATGVHAGFPGGNLYNEPFTLRSLSWTGGAADCTARVFHLSSNKNVTDALTSFHVDG